MAGGRAEGKGDEHRGWKEGKGGGRVTTDRGRHSPAEPRFYPVGPLPLFIIFWLKQREPFRPARLVDRLAPENFSPEINCTLSLHPAPIPPTKLALDPSLFLASLPLPLFTILFLATVLSCIRLRSASPSFAEKVLEKVRERRRASESRVEPRHGDRRGNGEKESDPAAEFPRRSTDAPPTEEVGFGFINDTGGRSAPVYRVRRPAVRRACHRCLFTARRSRGRLKHHGTTDGRPVHAGSISIRLSDSTRAAQRSFV